MTESEIHSTDSADEASMKAVDDAETGEGVGRSIAFLALFGFALAAFGLLVPLPFEGREASAIGDLAHAPLFGGMAMAILLLWHRISPLNSFGRSWLGRIALVCLSVFILGILVEFAQILTGRSPASHDVVSNGLGIMASALICIAMLNRKYQRYSRGITWVAASCAMTLVAISWVTPMQIIYDVVSVQTNFPIISSFESGWEETRWYLDDSTIEIVDEHVSDGERAIRWHIQPAKHPAITLLELPGDWSNVESFELDVTLAPDFDGEATLLVKVMDQDHADYHKDVCRKEFLLTPGKTRHLSVSREEILNGPDTRQIDLSRVKYVSLMCYRPAQTSWIDVDFMHVRLRP